MEAIYKKMKKNAVARFFGGFGLIVVSIIMIVLLNLNLVEYLITTTNLQDCAVEGLVTTNLNGTKVAKYYYIDCSSFVDWYASDDDGNRYYIIPIGTANDEVHYMGCYIEKKDVDKVESICDEYWNYLDGGAEPEGYFLSRGFVYQMDYDEKQCFSEYFTDDITDPQEAQEWVDCLEYVTFCPYSLSDVLGFGNYFSVILGVILIVCGIALMTSLVFGSYKKKFNKALSNQGITKERIANDMGSARNIGDFFIGSEYLVLATASPVVVAMNNTIWMYIFEQITKHRMYGVIPVGETKAYSLYVWDRYQNKSVLPLPKREQGVQVLEEVSKKAGWIFAGYNEQLAGMAQSNYARLVQAVDEKKMMMKQDDPFATQTAGVDPFAASKYDNPYSDFPTDL